MLPRLCNRLQRCGGAANAAVVVRRQCLSSRATQALSRSKVLTTADSVLTRQLILSGPSAAYPRYVHITASLRMSFILFGNLLISVGLGGDVVEVEGPAFAESISEGDIRWIKQKGDSVAADDLVAEIETDKTSVEVPAPFAGTIVELLVEDGAKVTAKQKLYKLQRGEGGAAAAEAPAAAAKTEKKEEPKKEEIPESVKPKEAGQIPKDLPKVPPVPKEPLSFKPTSDIKVTPPSPKPAVAPKAKGKALTSFGHAERLCESDTE
ncbi:Protein DLST-1 [Aphelenchoides avenae]|nr:Protein DLST-1 [Aphelenchus avenae]